MMNLFRLSGVTLILLYSQQLLGNLFVSVAPKAEEIKEGEEVVVSYFVQNNYTKPIEEVVVIDSLPKSVVLINANNIVKNDGRFLHFEIGRLDAFETYTFSVSYKFNRHGKIEHRIKSIYTTGEQDVKVENSTSYFYIKKNSTFDSKDLRLFFSPNGDGLNDVLVIKGLENYSNNTIEVFNRFNDKIFSAKNYDNSWDGGKTPSGNYFYILTIKLNDGREEKYSGSILLER